MDAGATRWQDLTRRALAELESCDPIYRPTNFWQPGVHRILNDMANDGLESFKRWSTATEWFYPIYGVGFTPRMIDRTFEDAVRINPAVTRRWLRRALDGTHAARRDFDAVRLAWDQDRWPFDLERLGESKVGHPPQSYRLMPDREAIWTRPYLNYLLCLGALSRHVERAPASFLEIGGGFGVLGEIVMSRSADARYVNLDIPPLLTVSSYYLDVLFGGRVTTLDAEIPATGPIAPKGSACLPIWRVADVAGPFDVFVNSYSFQEMEPAVVEHYVAQVAAKDVGYVVSLNSRLGKPLSAQVGDVGVVEQVTSDGIVDLFEAHGYHLVDRHVDPLYRGNAELVVMSRARQAPRHTRPTHTEATTIDHRLPSAHPATTPTGEGDHAPSQQRRQRGRRRLPAAVLDRARALRRRRGG